MKQIKAMMLELTEEIEERLSQSPIRQIFKKIEDLSSYIPDSYIPTFTISSSQFNTPLEEAIDGVVVDLLEKELECLLRLVSPTITPKNVYELPLGDSAAGRLSKELINRMMVGMSRVGKNLNWLVGSLKELEDIKRWTEADVDDETRRRILSDALAGGNVWGINLLFEEALPNYKDSILCNYGDTVENASYVLGFDNTDSLLWYAEPFSLSLTIQDDLIKVEGKQKIGVLCTDPNSLCLGVIRRYDS